MIGLTSRHQSGLPGIHIAPLTPDKVTAAARTFNSTKPGKLNEVRLPLDLKGPTGSRTAEWRSHWSQNTSGQQSTARLSSNAKDHSEEDSILKTGLSSRTHSHIASDIASGKLSARL